MQWHQRDGAHRCGWNLIRMNNAVTHRKRTICVRTILMAPFENLEMLGKGLKRSSDFEEIWRNFGGGIQKWKKW